MNPARPQLGISFCVALRCFALLCIALHCFALVCIALHCFALLCIALHCFALLCFALLCIALHCIALHCFAWLCVALLCFSLLCIALLCIALHCFSLLLDIFDFSLRGWGTRLWTPKEPGQIRSPRGTRGPDRPVQLTGCFSIQLEPLRLS